VGGPRVALGAAMWFALYKPEIMFVAEIEKTGLSILLTAATLVLFVIPGGNLRFPPSLAAPIASAPSEHGLRRAVAARFGAGITLGLGVLTRGNLLVFAPLGVLVLWLQGRDRTSLRTAGLFLTGFALALAPVAWRNHVVAGTWDPTTTQGGQNFYMGNNADNLSGSYGALPFLRMNPAFEEEDFRAEGERRAGRALGPRDTSRFWYGEAGRFFRERPATALALVGKKLALVWNDYEISDNQDQYILARDSWVMRLPLPGFGLTFAFAVVGVLATARMVPAVRLLVGFALVYATTVAAFFVFARYRIQLVPALIPLAAAGVAALATHARQARRLAVDAVALGGAAAFAFQTIQPYDHANKQIDAMRLHRLSDVHRLANDSDGAIAVLLEALAICPDRCPNELRALVALQEQTGNTPEAVAWLDAHVRAHPRDQAALAELTRLRAAGW